MSTLCGFDFGTSNSTLGYIEANQPKLAEIQHHGAAVRSAIFFDAEKKSYIFGEDGVSQYMSGVAGRLLLSLKSVLGSSLMHEKTYLNQQWVSYSDILGFFIRYMKNQAEMQLKKELDTVVMGRPVRFHDTDDKIDRLAQETLEQIAKDQGFKVVAFQYEPIAAALTYEQQITSEELALIVDLGGGTSDFTVIRLSPYQHQKTSREQDVLANHGIHIGGTDFDRLLSLKEVMPNFGLNGKMRGLTELIDLPSSYFHDLTTWHKINELYHPKIIAELKRILAMCTDKNKFQRFIATIEQRHGHRLLNDIEKAKRSLSIESDILLNLAYIENEFSLLLTRSGFERAIASQVKALGETIYETLQKALVTPQAIHAVFFTGGSTQIPCVYQLIQSFFPESKLIRGDVYGSVGYGLTLDAKKRFS